MAYGQMRQAETRREHRATGRQGDRALGWSGLHIRQIEGKWHMGKGNVPGWFRIYKGYPFALSSSHVTSFSFHFLVTW